MLRYKLDELGWFQFEGLCQALVKHSFSSTIESWSGHSDHGRDAFHKPTIKRPDLGFQLRGPIVFQIKFVQEANAAGARPAALLLKAFQAERSLIRKRRARKRWGPLHTYVLITNVDLTPELRRRIAASWRAKDCALFLFGGQDLCDWLHGSPAIRMAFPQLLGLQDLQTLIDDSTLADIRNRSAFGFEQAYEDAKVFVPTGAHSKALSVLAEHHFVVLHGPPEMGKTTIARSIVANMLALGWESHECRSPEDFLRAYRANAKQVFFVDDAFGSTEFRPDTAQEWAHDLAGILRALNQSHWLLLTSRPAPLKLALERMHLQGKAEQFPKPSDVLVNAADLDQVEKALILYRHAKAAQLSRPQKTAIRLQALRVVTDRHFTPERIRRLIGALGAENVAGNGPKDGYSKLIGDVLERPTEHMAKSLAALDHSHKWALISLLDSTASYMVVDDIAPTYRRFMEPGGEREFRSTLEVLSEHFVEIQPTRVHRNDSGDTWTSPETVAWLHPSWRDLVIEHLAASGNLRRRFLERCGVEGLCLAISVAGGATGQRRQPLIANEKDWEAFAASFERSIASASDDERNALLEGIGAAMEAAEYGEEEERARYVDVALRGTKACRLAWDAAGVPIDLSALETYLQLSTQLDPMPPCPQLGPTWGAVFDAALSDLSSWGAESLGRGGVRDAMRVLNLAIRNEPRWLKRIQFPAAQSEALATCLELLEAWLGTDQHGALADANALSERIARLQEASVLANEMRMTDTERGKQWAQCAAGIESALERRRKELAATNEDVDDWNSEKTISEDVGIGTMFSDL